MENFEEALNHCYLPIYDFFNKPDEDKKFEVTKRIKHENSSLSLIITIEPKVDDFNWDMLKIIPFQWYYMIYYGSESIKYDLGHTVFNTNTADSKFNKKENKVTLTLHATTNPIHIDGLRP